MNNGAKLLHSTGLGGVCELDGTLFLVVSHQEHYGETVTIGESFGDAVGRVVIARNEDVRLYQKYDTSKKERAGECARDIDEIKVNGRDVLADALPSFTFESVQDMLPSYGDDAYIPLGHPSAERMATVDRMGNIFRQKMDYEILKQLECEEKVYSPAALFGSLGGEKPVQSFLDGIYPLLWNVHEDGGKVLEGLYIYETGNYRSGSALYVRNTVYDKSSGKIERCDFRIIGVDCITDYDAQDALLDADVFYDCLLNTLEYYENFEKNNTKVTLPIKALERSHIGTLFTIEGLFNAERMRYGHRIYGTTYHDFFPPNFITSILAYAMNSQTLKAGRLVEYVLANAVDLRGRVLYRQGDGQNYGFSASELGQFLWVLSRVEGIIEPSGRLLPYKDKLAAMGMFLLSRIVELEYMQGVYAVRTCAEADTNERVHDYLENTLWSIRGFEALLKLGDRLGFDTSEFAAAVHKLKNSVDTICERTAADSEYGRLIPFRIDYTPLPLTLSKGCQTTSYPVSDEEFALYAKGTPMRSDKGVDVSQDLTENVYANYRYYPEMLSSCLLGEEYEKSILRLREAVGGELLGMVRWGIGMDDWPAYNLAINYIERGEIDKYLLLLYAHASHHGLIDYHIYYEQILLGKTGLGVRADSSVPSILLNNLMINMMFCYESVDGSNIELLKAIPHEWFGAEAFSIENVRTSRGAVSVFADCEKITVRLDGDFDGAVLWLGKRTDAELEAIASRTGGIRAENGRLVIEKTAPELTVYLK